MLPQTEAHVREQAEESRDVCLEWATYFALMAKLFGQQAIAFNAIAKVPSLVSPPLMHEAANHIRAIDRDCGAFRDGMTTVGNEFNSLVERLNKSVRENTAKTSEELSVQHDKSTNVDAQST